MKVWRGFTLTVWVILLTLLAAFFMQYRALQTTVLDAKNVKAQLVQSGTYEKLRDTLLLDKLTTGVAERYPNETLIARPLLQKALTDALPASEVQKRFEPAVDALYRWLDSKEPEISFSVDLSDRVEVFYRSLEVQLSDKIASLPSCGDYRYPPENAILVDKCLPLYATAPEATTAAMSAVRSTELPNGNTLSAESFAVPATQKGSLAQIPTYLNYLWVLNWVAIALFVLISLLLLVSRRALGFIAVGVSLIAASLSVWLTLPIVRGLKITEPDGVMSLVSGLTSTFINAFTAASARYGLVSFLIGLTLILGAWGWRFWQRKRSRA